MSSARLLAKLAGWLGVDGRIPAKALGSGSILQVKTVNWADRLVITANPGSGQTLLGGWSFIPTQNYVDITAVGSNSKFVVMFTGNMTPSAEQLSGDWIGGFGFVVDPAGGTNWIRFGSGSNAGFPNNGKIMGSRASITAGGNDIYWVMPLNACVPYQSSAAAGAKLRFAVEYFHYSTPYHSSVYVNRPVSASDMDNGMAYGGTYSTSLVVMEIAG